MSFRILAPAMQAKASADIAQSRNTVAGLEQTELMRAMAHDEMPLIRNDWIRATQIDDATERVKQQAQVLSRAAKYESVGELSGEIKLWKEVLAHGFTTSRTLDAITGRGEIAKEIADTKATSAKAIADAKAESDRQLAEVKAGHAQEIQRLQNEGTANAADKVGRYRKNLQEARDSGDAEGVSLYTALLDKATASPINTANGSEQMRLKLEEAKAGGDPQEIQYWEKRIRALTERGVRKDPSAMIDAITKGLGGGTAKPGSAAPTQPQAAKPGAPVSDPFKNIKL